jgi:hypothetical protein
MTNPTTVAPAICLTRRFKICRRIIKTPLGCGIDHRQKLRLTEREKGSNRWPAAASSARHRSLHIAGIFVSS